jgi:CBS domain-containing protein
MTQTIRDVMTKKPVALDHTATVVDAARAMREGNFGTVIVVKNGKVCGVVTDRDIVIRAVAGSHDPRLVTIGEICTEDVMTVGPDEPLAQVIMLMREKAIRRVPVVEDGHPVGVVSLGDLAKKNDEGSTLTEISSAKPNQ